jgi:hypothetical protein
VFLLSAGWFTQANTGAAGSPIGGGTNSIANGGGDMQIFSDTATTTRLPIEVVTFVTGGSPQCQVWVRTPSYTAGDTITIGKDDTQTTQPAVGAAFGRNATWVDFELMINSGTFSDSTGNHAPVLNGSPLTTTILNSLGYILDDATKYISIPYVAALDIEKNYSVEMWVERLGTFTGRDYVSTIDPSNNTGFRFLSGGTDSIRTRHPNLSPANLTGADAVNGPKRIGSNYDGTTRSNTLDGAIVNSDTPTGTVTNSGEDLWIGNSQANQSMEGVLGDFFLRKVGISSDLRDSEYTNQSNPDNFGTSSEYILVGGSGISVTGDTAAFDYNALAGTVDLTGEILVTGSTASFDYTAINGSIDLTGQLLITGQTANFDYIALPGAIDLTGEIIVTGSTANFDYTGENGIVELGAVINVVGQTANFDFDGVNAEVSLTGEITIIGDTATFDYVAKSGIVVIGEGQKIGTVTAGFAQSTIGVQYKQNTITVNFGE